MSSSRVSLLDSSRANSMIVAPAQIVARALGMITTVILARHLTVDEYGVYSLIIGSLIFFNLVTNWGMGSALQRFIPEYARTAQYGRLFKTFIFSEVFRAITGIVAIVLALACFEPVSKTLKVEGYRSEYLLFCIGSFSFFQIEFLYILFNSLFLQKFSALGQIGCLGLRLLLIIVLVIIWNGKLASVFVSELVAYLFACVVMWYLFLKYVYWPLRPQLEKAITMEKLRVWRYSLLSAATIPGSFLFSHAMDYFVVATMATTNQLGIYALGSRASNMLISMMPQNVMQTLVRPVFFHQYCSVKDKNAELNRMFRTLVMLIAAVLFPVLAFVSIQAEPILFFVFKAKFAESTPILIMFLAFNAFTILELPSDLTLQAIEKVQARLYAQIFAVYNVVAAILLMRHYGLVGVAFATGSAIMAKCLFWYFMARYYTGIKIPGKALARIAVNTVLAAGVTYMVGRLSDSPWWILASLSAGSGAYIVLTLMNNFMSRDEKKLTNQFCKRQIFHV